MMQRLLLLAVLVPAAAAAAPVGDAAQVARGAELYAGQCAMCHGPDLAGSYDVPSLGGPFLARWAGAPLDRLFGYLKTAMPLHAPGTLSAAETADVLAFLLARNAVAEAARPIPADRSGLGLRRLGPPHPAR
jgi:mono/diheme cytochrome c family protein